MKAKIMENKDERREFNRFQIEFWMEVHSEDSKGERFEEKTVLRDISGGGANFVTRNAEKYYPGQKLLLILFLPGSNQMNARMNAKAQVIRIGSDTSGMATVAVKFETILNFER